MQSRLRLIAIPVAVALISLACTDSGTGVVDPQARIALPQPVQEPNHAIPDDERIYFKEPADAYYQPSRESFMAAMKAHVEEVLAARIRIDNAWIPKYPDLCMAMGSLTVIIIETDKPYDYLVDLGWIESPPSFWLINCGVDSLWHYDFDRD